MANGVCLVAILGSLLYLLLEAALLRHLGLLLQPPLLLLWIATVESTADELSQYILSGFSMLSTTLNPGINFFSHIACPVASKQAINLAYIVDDATMDCLQLFHDTAPPTRVN
ncbi:hypothetical protein BS78_05G278300, partial [Paspalum vaginatum]